MQWPRHLTYILYMEVTQNIYPYHGVIRSCTGVRRSLMGRAGEQVAAVTATKPVETSELYSIMPLPIL